MRLPSTMPTPPPFTHDRRAAAELSLWLAATTEPAESAPPLEGRREADVCIVGGGFCGLWSAVLVKRARPQARVVLLEARTCGSGPSGRNGGFMMSWWSKFTSLAKLVGAPEALRLCRASARVMDETAQLCDEHGIDAGVRREGWLWMASNSAQVDAWCDVVRALEGHGEAPFRTLDRDEAQELGRSSTILGGVYEPTCATVQPAELALGLRRVARRLGVEVYEHTPVRAVRGGSPAVVRTQTGAVRAEHVLVTVGAWTGALVSSLRRSIVVMASDMVATAPAPERLDELGLRRGLAICDARLLVNYFHRTGDDRLAWGTAGGALAFGSHVSPSFSGPSPRSADLEGNLRRFYPTLGAPIERSWTGPIDRSFSGLPYVIDDGQGVTVAAGFSGNGVGPSRVVAEILAAVALGEDSVWAQSPLIGRRPKGYVAEPARFVGGLLVRAAVAGQERAQDEDRTPSRLLARLVALAPAGLATGGGAQQPAAASPHVSASVDPTKGETVESR